MLFKTFPQRFFGRFLSKRKPNQEAIIIEIPPVLDSMCICGKISYFCTRKGFFFYRNQEATIIRT